MRMRRELFSYVSSFHKKVMMRIHLFFIFNSIGVSSRDIMGPQEGEVSAT